MSSGPRAHAAPSSGGRASPVVARTALFQRLSAGGDGGVTLLSAPPGSGKTVLLRSWIRDSGLAHRVAWVTVERQERDSQRFWLSVMENLCAAAGANAFVEKLAPSPDFDGEAVVDRVVGQLGSLEEPVVLVIDDLHELGSREALSQLEGLLARRPPLLHVILATRRDPQLGLHRLRLAGDLVEIRDSDLRFSLEETRQLMTAAGIVLSDESVAQLHARTEGWAAGLRLAAISLSGHPEPERFVVGFSGSERTVADYLLGEVLERQTDEVKRLLLRTSILEKVSGPLADVLVGSSGSERVFHALEQQNAFIMSLDSERTWFRYHQLFADLLRLELRRTDPGAIPALHRSAAAWYGEHGYVVEAVRHALASEDWAYAAQLLAEHVLRLALNGEEATVRALLASFPPGLASDPELALVSAFAELTGGSLDDAAAYVSAAERNTARVSAGRRQRFEVQLALVRLTLGRMRGDFNRVLGEAERLRESIETQFGEVALGQDGRALAMMNLGMVELWSSRFEEAEWHLQQALELSRRIRRPYVEVSCLSYLAAIASGRSYREAREMCNRAIAITEARGWAGTRVDCVALAMMGIADVVQGRFEDARYWLDQAQDVLRPQLEPAVALLVDHARGMLFFGLGLLDRALTAFSEANQLQTLLVTPHVLTVQARWFLVQTQLKLDDMAGARRTLGELSDDERRWGEADIALASLQLAEGDARGAADTLAPVRAGVVPVLRELSLIDAVLVDAIVREHLGERQAVEADIEEALNLAETETIIFPFITVAVRELLERHPRHRTAHGGLLSVILNVLGGSPAPARSGKVDKLAEDLSGSELRVLRFLPSNLSAPEIGAELYLSTSTVKTHMRHIYAKLEVHSRTEAVERARQLGLLGPSSRQPR